MESLWFIVPAHGRVELARVCLRQLRRTCAERADYGVRASAIVIAEDENLDTAASLGFGTIERDNRQLGRKWNDGYQLAGREGVDYCVPLGTDDWVDAATIAALPRPGEIRCSRSFSMVREDGARLARLRIPYDGGHGVRVFPTALLRPLGYRPAEDDRARAIDTSVLVRITRAARPTLTYLEAHPFQMIDWKSRGEQLNSYASCQRYREGTELHDPFRVLAGLYPAEALAEMQALYQHDAEASTLGGHSTCPDLS